MKKAKLAASLIAVSMAATTLLTGCNGSTPGNSDSPSGSNSSDTSSTPGDNSSSGGETSTPPSTPSQAGNLPFAGSHSDNVEIRIAAGYDKTNTGITFDADTVGEGLKLSDGKTYTTGMLKPTWQQLSETLKIKFKDVWTGKKASDNFPDWQPKLEQVDVVSGTAKALNEAGAQGSLVDLSKYLDKMPNFKAYLDNNPIVRMSITSYKPEKEGGGLGAIYFAPYFDGVDDIERMPLMRTDWAEKLLNGPTAEFKNDNATTIKPGAYTPYMDESGKIEVDIVKKDGSGTEKLTKDLDAAGGNIVKQMNDAGEMDGVAAVKMLREYIDKAYGGHYGDNRADLFIGQDAAWDADEMVALLRCVVSNGALLNSDDGVVEGLFSREDGKNNRRVDMYKFAGILFGARGLESRQDYLYIDKDKKLHDARQEEATYKALEKMNQMVKEGLVSKTFVDSSETKQGQLVEKDKGFLTYDYNQTQTVWNEDGKLDTAAGEKFRAILVPVAKWFDGSNDKGVIMRFTESWRSVKDSGWAIPITTEEKSEDVLNACLHLFDYAFSLDGQILMSYGPDAFIDVKDPNGKTIEEKYNTFEFNGVQMPKISKGCYEDLWKLQGGNYTNFGRRCLGSTLHFVKSQAFEYQCTTEVGKEGAALISKAIALGVIKHPVLSTSSANSWYTSVPTILPIPTDEINTLNGLEISKTKVFGTGSGDTNVLISMIVSGYAANECPGSDAAKCAATVADTWKGKTYLEMKQDGWDDILNY